jgi:hypothetical protein
MQYLKELRGCLGCNVSGNTDCLRRRCVVDEREAIKIMANCIGSMCTELDSLKDALNRLLRKSGVEYLDSLPFSKVGNIREDIGTLLKEINED